MLQVKLMNLDNKFYKIEVSGIKEKEVNELLKGLSEIIKDVDFDYIIIGGIASNYQKRRFEKIAEILGVELYSPQWGEDPSEYLIKLVKNGFEFIITEIKVYGLSREFIGTAINEEMVRKIISRSEKYGFNPAFEGGEAETLVLYQPLFGNKRLCLEGHRRSLNEFEHFLDIRDVWIEHKDSNCLKIYN